MIQSILEFRDTVVREVMIPRTEIVAISSSATIEEILDLIIKYGHTRMPVYSGNVDNIVGILNVKDLLKFWSKPVRESDIISCLRSSYYIPETKNIHLLLHELKQKKYHMAIVIDEYGGTSGLVTLEDLIEEIEPKRQFTKASQFKYIEPSTKKGVRKIQPPPEIINELETVLAGVESLDFEQEGDLGLLFKR